MCKKIVKSKISIFILICFSLSLIFFTGCVSQIPSSNSSTEFHTLNNTRILNLTNGMYSINATVPVITCKMMTYFVEKPNYSQEWVTSLAKNLGMSGKIREGDKAFYTNMDDEEIFYFVVFKDERKITFKDLHGNLSNNLTEEMALSSVKRVLTSSGLLFHDASDPEFTSLMGKCPLSSDEGKKDCKKIIVSYTRSTNGLPMLGSTMMVTVGSQGKVIDMSIIWPDYRPYKEVALKSPEQTFEEFQIKDLYFVGPENPIKPEKVFVSHVSLVYSSANGKYLQPMYLFIGYGQQGERMQKFDAVQIPASSEVLE